MAPKIQAAMKRGVLYVLLSLFVHTAHAGIIDSLENALKKEPKDTSKLFLLDELVWECLYSDMEKAGRYAHEALLLAEHTKPSSFLARAHHSMATVFLQQNLNDSALIHFKRAIKLYEGAQMEEKMASSYNGLGNVFLYQGVFEKALENYLLSLRLLEKTKSPKGKIGLVTANIGVVYFNLENYSKAIEYYNLALKIAQETSDSSGIASAYTNLGNIYKDLEKYDECEPYFVNAIAIYERIGEDFGKANCLANLGGLAKREKDIMKAMEYYQQALDIFSKLKSDDGICAMYYNFGGVYLETKEYPKAIDYLHKSIAIAEKIGALNRVMEAYSTLHEVYAAMNEPGKAYEALLLYMAAKDSVLNEENSKNIARMQTLYETGKVERELIEKDAELKQKTIQQNAMLFAGAILLILVLVVYRSYREKRKANISITFQKEVIEQKNKDITDSINYAKRIQTAILPSKEFVKKLFPQSFVYYQPRDIVSGDFYFFAEVGAKRYAAACDCTGHGVPGAFMSMIGNDFLHRIVNELHITDTADILNALHANILKALHQDVNRRTASDGMDVAVFCYDSEKSTVQYSGALRPLYCFDKNGFRELKGDRSSIGADLSEFTSQTFSAEAGSSFYLFSDGYADQFGGNEGKKFMAKRFKDLLAGIQGKSMHEQEKALHDALTVWKKEREQVDDILVIGIRL